jgi:hypothetical protein
LFFNQTFMQKDQMVGDLAGETHLMGHHHHGAALECQVFHDLQHFGHQFRVERAGGFVKKHHLGLHRQRTGNRHTLLLTTTQVRRIGVLLALQPHLGQVFAGNLDRLIARYLHHMHRRFDDVLQHRHVRPQVEMLKHHGQFGAQARELLWVGGVQFTIRAGA